MRSSVSPQTLAQGPFPWQARIHSRKRFAQRL
jgi:hypothetical protein